MHVAERLVTRGQDQDVGGHVPALDIAAEPEPTYAGGDAEPFGNVHLEALASGVPVVTTAAAGGSELIEEGKNGAVVAPGDPEALAAAVLGLRSAGPGSLGEAARRSAEPFTYDAQAGAFERLYRKFP